MNCQYFCYGASTLYDEQRYDDLVISRVTCSACGALIYESHMLVSHDGTEVAIDYDTPTGGGKEDRGQSGHE